MDGLSRRDKLRRIAPARDSQPFLRVDCLVSLPCGRQSLFPKRANGLVCEDFARVLVQSADIASGSHRPGAARRERPQSGGSAQTPISFCQDNRRPCLCQLTASSSLSSPQNRSPLITNVGAPNICSLRASSVAAS